jgi:hypothetical protein
MPSRRDIRAGDPVDRMRAADWNRLVEELECLGNLTVTAPLRLQEGPGGRALTLVAPPGFYARLGGGASPYSFSEVYPALDGTFPTLTDGRAGTANAHEVNAVAGLNSKVEWLIPGALGDWRFQHVARGTTGPTGCIVTVHLQDRATGAGIAGGAVTIRRLGAVVATGTTNSSGDYAVGSLATGTTFQVTIVYDGLTQVGTASCGGTLSFSYCKAIVTLTTEPDSLATFGSSTLSPPPLEDLGGGMNRWTYRELFPTSTPSRLPADVTIAASKDGYVSRCVDVTVHCGDNIAVALPMFNYVDDYFVPVCACPAAPCQDLGDAPDNAGIAPKVLLIRWSVVYQVDPGGPAAPGPLGYTSASIFGSNAETWIPITWDGVNGNGLNTFAGSLWDSGCLASDGRTITCPSGTPATRACASTRTTLRCNVGDVTFTANYIQYPAAACANTSPGCIGTISVTGEHGAGDSGVCTPVTGTATGLITSGSTGGFAWAYYFTCELTE